MALTGTLRADFSEFIAAVTKAEKHITDMAAGADKAGARLNAMQDSFSGKKIIQDATLISAAVERAGGASVLTAKEMARVNATVTEAIAKYAALGQTAPRALTDLAEATKRVEAPTQGLSTKMVALGTAIGTMAANALIALAKLAVEGIGRIVTGMGDLILSGAGVADVGENFTRLTSQAGLLGQTLLGTLRAGTHATVTDFELMKTVNQDLAAGMVLTDQQFGALAKGAFALAQATGTDVKGALDTMNDAMLTGRTRALALLTGKIDLEAAEIKYAKSIGLTRKDLDDTMKLEAARAGILDGVTAATNRLGVQTDGLDEKVAQATTSWANFKEQLGAALATSPVLAAALDSVGRSLTEAFGGSQEKLIKAITVGFNQFAIFVVDAGIYLVEFGRIGVQVFQALTVPQKAVTASMIYLVERFAAGIAVMSELAASLPGVGGAFSAVSSSARKTADTWGAMRQEASRALDSSIDMARGQGVVMRGIDQTSAALWDMKAAMVTAIQSTTETTTATDKLARTSAPAAAGIGNIGDVATEVTPQIERLTASFTKQIKAHEEAARKVVPPAMIEGWRLLRVELEGTAPVMTRTLQATADAEDAALKWAQANGAVLAPSVMRVGVVLTETNAVTNTAGDTWKKVGDVFADVAAILDHLPGKFVEIAAVAARTGKAIVDNLAAGDIFGAIVSGVTGAATVISKLFTDQNKAQVIKYNAEIEKLRAGLLVTHGTLDALEAAGQRVGISFRENWGHQGAAGLKAMNDLMREFEQRTQAVGAALNQVSSGFSAVVTGMTKPWTAFGLQLEASRQELEDTRRAFDALGSSASADQLAAGAEKVRLAGEAYQFLSDTQKELAQTGKQELADLGVVAVAAFGAAMVAGKTYAEALALIGPSTATLGAAFKALGLDVEDVGLKHLILQSTVAKGNPELIAAASGLGSAMQGLAQLGMLNVDAFAAMQRTGSAMYARLQGEVANLGGETSDALLPMQSYLHQAAIQAALLGIPLDDNTQRLIDQSKELGIWKEQGASAQDKLIEGMTTMVAKVDELLTKMLGFSGAITGLPSRRDIEINVTTNELVLRTVRDVAGDSGSRGPIMNVDWGGQQASGGDYFVTRPTLFLAGEAGPERATFSGAGQSGGSNKADERLERLIRDLPRAMKLAVQDAMVGA